MNENKLKPFDFEQAKQGAKVVTRDGMPVRIICWDRTEYVPPTNPTNPTYPIVALIKYEDGEEEINTYTMDGVSEVGCNGVYDIFMAPTIVEKWVNVYENKNGGNFYGRYYDSEQEALENYQEYKNAKYIATATVVWEV